MSPLTALLLGVLEGLTELLPVSSTGHLVLLSALLGHADEASKTLDVVMQLGAVLAVLVYYRALFREHAVGFVRGDPRSRRVVLALVVAFAPVAVVGLALRKVIKRLLFGPSPVAWALVVGGVVMIGVELYRQRLARRQGTTPQTMGLVGLEHVTPARALAIGLGQCLSLWPGASRSMTTIVSGQLTGLSTATAAEFSFLLSVPVLGAATVLDLVKEGEALAASGALPALGIATVTSFVVTLAVIAGFLRYLRRFGLLPFGVYRIVLGAVVLALVSRATST
jgi:undecaprenyl-diphosphatase